MTPETDPSGKVLRAADPSDLELLRRAQDGDDAAFEEVVGRHGRDLYGLAYFLTGQASDAEDVVQETFLGAYESMAVFQARSSVKTWLSRILVNQAAKHRRSQRVRKAVQPMNLSAASTALLGGAGVSEGATASDVRMFLRCLKFCRLSTAKSSCCAN
jgi:DNA-directed RNA polymerase specialized sigma24 family protein